MQPIGVFDSGVGGLSILKELRKLLPHENFVFLADQLYLPYGEKSRKFLENRAVAITDYFIKNHDIKMLVVACNTATARTINALRKKYALPIVGTIPAIKSAAENTKSGTIAVLSTPSTSKSLALKKLIEAHAKNLNVINISCKDLAMAVDKGDLNTLKTRKLLQKYLMDIKNSNTDQLVLGCTQYPFLKEQIREILGSRIKLIDSGEAIAKHAKALLSNNKIKNKAMKKGEIIYFTTGNSVRFAKVATILLKTRIKAQSVKV